MSVYAVLALALAATACALPASGAPPRTYRPPAVPLIATDPYFSIWSCGDKLTDGPTRHWTGRVQTVTSLIRVDGTCFRLLGSEPKALPALPQTGVAVTPTATAAEFRGAGVSVTLTFLTPMLPDDLDLLSRSLTYITWSVRPTDAKAHSVQIAFDAAGEIVVNEHGQRVQGSLGTAGALGWARIGSADQPVLAKKGDDLRIDWGHLYVAAPRSSWRLGLGAGPAVRDAFAAAGKLVTVADDRLPRAANDAQPVVACAADLGVVRAAASRTAMVAYDDEWSIEYFHERLRPFWRRNGMTADGLLTAAWSQHADLRKRSAAFDKEMTADLTRVGGPDYARMCALAYRQSMAANKIAADANGQPLQFPKECFSNGCINTVDIIYPQGPLPLLVSPSLAKASLQPVMDYAASPRWKWPFAPHDLGTYPKANGQVYGGGERTEENQMPVEESGNMLILLAALAKVEGNADYAARYWRVVTKWAEYLESTGLDPENQLCTDDFAGHLAHNVNLSVKAIVALGAYGLLCDMRGMKADSARYRDLARDYAAKWQQMADDGDHFRLAFDKPGTWSQKYNLVWDRILGLGLFPPEVAAKEMAYYRKTQGKYGIPLDNRQPYTKTDWLMWTATLTGLRDDFDAIAGPAYDFLSETPDRVPMTDWYWTQNARMVGFRARSVVGGIFLRMLYEPAVWRKWAQRDVTKAAGWAPLPVPPKVETVIPAADLKAAQWKWTTEKPAPGWEKPGFTDGAWAEGTGGFGTAGTPGAIVGTQWNTSDIWLRKTLDLSQEQLQGDLRLWLHHDEDVEVYINGVMACKLGGYVAEYETAELTPAGRAALRSGANTFAVHCRQTSGGQYIDVGLVRVVKAR